MARYRYVKCDYYNELKDTCSKDAKLGFDLNGCLDCRRCFSHQCENIDVAYIKNATTKELIDELSKRKTSVINVDKLDSVSEIAVKVDTPCYIIVVDKRRV